jgi:SAM-dependent methyltransferase
VNTVFNAYAAYYDLLYKDKDYVGEARYVLDLLSRHGMSGRRILDLGCGTGRHACLFAEAGYEVDGVDLSPNMITEALGQLPKELAGNVHYQVGDVRNVDLGHKFDAVVSLFHVASYQTRTADLKAMFSTASRHLTKGGIFLFDFWYGPGVLSDPPVVRVRRMEGPDACVTRIAEPHSHPELDVVDVNYEVLVTSKSSGQSSTLREQHRMRYLFLPELEEYLQSAGLRVRHAERWLGGSLGSDCWNAVIVASRD